MSTNGKVTSGICSTRNRAYENTPRTTMPTITMVAKTGFLIETRVIHIAVSSSDAGSARPQVAPADLERVDARTSAGAPALRLSNGAASTGEPGGRAVLIST